MAELVQTPTSRQSGDAFVVNRGGSPANVTSGDAAVKNVGTGSGDVAAGNRGLPAGGSTGDVLKKSSGTDYAVEWGAGGGGGEGGLAELAEDLSPQLGGDLDLNGNVILGMVLGTNVQAWSAVLDGTTASFTTALKTKVDGLPDAATLSSTLGAKAPLSSPTFTGTPAAPTASGGNNTTQLATTAFVQGELAAKANLASPTFTGVPAAPTASAGTSTTQLATTAFVQGETTGAEIADRLGGNYPEDDGVLRVDDGVITVQPVIPSTGASNRYWKLDASGNFVLAQFDEMAADLASLAASVVVTGTGEKDIAVTAVTTNVRIAPSGGNMTIDDVTGMYLGQAINVTLLQDTSDRTLGLAGGTNCVLGHDDALDMPSGSGAIARGLLVGMDDGAGGVTPTFLRVEID